MFISFKSSGVLERVYSAFLNLEKESSISFSVNLQFVLNTGMVYINVRTDVCGHTSSSSQSMFAQHVSLKQWCNHGGGPPSTSFLQALYVGMHPTPCEGFHLQSSQLVPLCCCYTAAVHRAEWGCSVWGGTPQFSSCNPFPTPPKKLNLHFWTESSCFDA